MKFKASANLFADSGVVTFREGWRPVVHGTPTLTEWPVPFFFSVSGVWPFCEGWRPVFFRFLRDANPHTIAIVLLFPIAGVWPFCEGWRPVKNGTPTLTEWPVPFVFPCFWRCAIL